LCWKVGHARGDLRERCCTCRLLSSMGEKVQELLPRAADMLPMLPNKGNK